MGISRLGGTEKAGDIKLRAYNDSSMGWLECNGATISRTTYAALFAAIGTTYGAGDGATTFKIPDLRGEFIRGYDNGRGVDSGRVIGSAQAADLASHSHQIRGTLNGTFAAGSQDIHRDNDGATTDGWNFNTNAAGGTETRPRNVAMKPFIKF